LASKHELRPHSLRCYRDPLQAEQSLSGAGHGRQQPQGARQAGGRRKEEGGPTFAQADTEQEVIELIDQAMSARNEDRLHSALDYLNPNAYINNIGKQEQQPNHSLAMAELVRGNGRSAKPPFSLTITCHGCPFLPGHVKREKHCRKANLQHGWDLIFYARGVKYLLNIVWYVGI